VDSISAEAMDVLMRHAFPGNVRELENIIQRAVVMSRESTITTKDLPPDIGATAERSAVSADDLFHVGDLHRKLEQLEKMLIEQALEESGNNQVKAADLLHISERTLRYKLSKLRDI